MHRLSFAFLALVACGQSKSSPNNTTVGASSGTSGGSSGGTALTAETFVAQLTHVVCDNEAPACCQSAGFVFSAANCASNVAMGFTVSGTHSKFSASAAKACLDAFTKLGTTCSVDDKTAAACVLATIYVGSVPPGGDCTADTDCAAQAGNGTSVYCDNSGSGTDGFCASTTTATSAGAVCGQSIDATQPTSAECGSSLYCDGNQCQPLPALGASCLGACQDNLYCGANSVCVPLLAGGAACALADVCVTGYACDPTNHCAAQLASGAVCDPNATWGECADDCDANTLRCLADNSLADDSTCGAPSD